MKNPELTRAISICGGQAQTAVLLKRSVSWVYEAERKGTIRGAAEAQLLEMATGITVAELSPMHLTFPDWERRLHYIKESIANLPK